MNFSSEVLSNEELTGLVEALVTGLENGTKMELLVAKEINNIKDRLSILEHLVKILATENNPV